MALNPALVQKAAEVKVSNEDLAALSSQASLLKTKMADLEKMEMAMAEMSAFIRRLSEETIPQTMTKLGMVKFTLTDGTEVTVKPFYGAHIKDENKSAAFAWLRENGKGALIKTEIITKFGMGEEDDALRVKEMLEDNSIAFSAKEAVHSATLTSFVKEQFEAGTPLPDLFGAFAGQKAKLSNKK